MDAHEEGYNKEADRKVIQKWTARFTKADAYGKPYRDKNLRMYKLYRGYRDVGKYAYQTRMIPPIGFEIIETIKPRLASAKMKIRILPTKREDVKNKSINSWDELVEYNLDQAEFTDIKIAWIDAMLKYGNGTLQMFWNGDENGYVGLEVADNWLMYVDPSSKERFKECGWIIKRSFKNKQTILDEEEERGEERYLYDPEKIEKLEDRVVGDDPRRDRYQINTLKMGQVDAGTRNDTAYDQDSSAPDKQEKKVEIWECFDLRKKTITTIMNRECVARNESSAYATVNGSNLFIDLPDISLGWEYYAMGHLEPVEVTIGEIADSRNQAMDSIMFSLDPIRKIRKGAGINADDIVHAPGATWELAHKDDVIFERPPEVSRMWIEKDQLLRTEIQTSLALSEYTQGAPHSSQEPASKVDLLLMQSNIRFSLIVRQMEISFTKLVNSIIEMNRAFLGEQKLFRIVGKDGVSFKEFTASDKEVTVDAKVEIEPRKEKTPEQKERELIDLYKMLILEDVPDPNNTEEVNDWKHRKIAFQKMILQEFDKGEYEEVLVSKFFKNILKEQPKPEGAPQEMPEMPMGAPIADPLPPPPPQQPENIPQPIPLLETEGAPQHGMMDKLRALFK